MKYSSLTRGVTMYKYSEQTGYGRNVGIKNRFTISSLGEQETIGIINRSKQMKGRCWLGTESEHLQLGMLVLECW